MKTKIELFFLKKVYQRIFAFKKPNSNGYHDQGKRNKNIVKAAQDLISINISESLWHSMKKPKWTIFPEKVYQRFLAFKKPNSNGYHDQGKQQKNYIKAAQDTELI